jgi:hypothetical protein
MVMQADSPAPVSAAAQDNAADAPFPVARDYHLFSNGSKRILALDGGGVRGAISVAFLERIEQIFATRQCNMIADYQRALGLARSPGLAEFLNVLPIRLADHFDLIGGTSTGAIIAGALALGHNTERIKAFYLEKAAKIFPARRWRLQGLQSKFDAGPLREEIKDVVKERTLASPDIVTGLCMVAKRMDTGSPWILSNSPLAPYWEPDRNDPDKFLPNKDYMLSNLVRASTAAPHFFDPEFIPITKKAQKAEADAERIRGASASPSLLSSRLKAVYHVSKDALARQFRRPGEKPHSETHGLFIDGGVTPYNNPALALLMVAALKKYGLCWPLDPNQLTLVSVGTGWHRRRLSFKQLRFLPHPRLAMRALLSLMGDAEIMALALMQWLGQCDDPWEINSEIGDLSDDWPAGRQQWFRFVRYDLRLEKTWLKKHIDVDLSERELERLHRMDRADNIPILYELAKIAAQRQVKAEHFFPRRAASSPPAPRGHPT